MQRAFILNAATFGGYEMAVHIQAWVLGLSFMGAGFSA